MSSSLARNRVSHRVTGLKTRNNGFLSQQPLPHPITLVPTHPLFEAPLDENSAGISFLWKGGDDMLTKQRECHDEHNSEDNRMAEIIQLSAAIFHDEDVHEVLFGPGSIGLAFSDFSCVEVSNRSAKAKLAAPIVVTRVERHTQADLNGVKAGDLIVSLNCMGLSTKTTRDEFLELLVACERPMSIGFRHVR
jgi:hypothetical protein